MIGEADERVAAARKVVFIQCVGSRNEENPYCSKVCCTHSLKSAIALKEMDPRKRVYVVYRDIRSYGFREDLYQKARAMGVLFIRYDLEKMPRLRLDGDGNLAFKVIDHVLQMEVLINPDLVVLASGITPGDNRALFEKFKIPVNAEGFLVEAHAKLRPVDFASDGLFLAGLAHYPKPLEETISQARAAAARAMTSSGGSSTTSAAASSPPSPTRKSSPSPAVSANMTRHSAMVWGRASGWKVSARSMASRRCRRCPMSNAAGRSVLKAMRSVPSASGARSST